MLNITNHEGNANQDHSEALPHTCQNGYHQKDSKQEFSVGTVGLGSSIITAACSILSHCCGVSSIPETPSPGFPHAMGAAKKKKKKKKGKKRKKDMMNVLKNIKKREPFYTVGGNVTWYSHCGKLYGTSTKN